MIKRKFLSLILSGILAVGICTTGSAAQSSQGVTVMPEIERPEVKLLDSMDKKDFVGTYWQGEVLHIIPVPGREEKLNSTMTSKSTLTRSAAMPRIVVDSAPVQTRSAVSVYSMEDRETGKAYLIKNKNMLNIQAVGFTADKLAVFMNQNATDADKQAVLNASPVKTIEFFGALFTNNNDKSSIDDYLSTKANDIQLKATSTTLRGGNWIRRTSSKNWSTITVSAVRNWNGSSGDIGFITCGHGWTDGQSVYASDKTKVGIADVQLYNNMDVTFVKLDNTNLNSRGYMSDGKRITNRTSISAYDVSKPVKKYGARVKTPQKGVIKVVEISGVWNNCNYDNLFLTNCNTRAGDSGGAFVMNDDTIVGLMVGARASSPTDPNVSGDPLYLESVALPISDVVSETGFIPAS